MLNLNKEEVARYLKHSGPLDDMLTDRLERVYRDFVKNISPKLIFSTFSISTTSEKISFVGTDVDVFSKDLRDALLGYPYCVLMVATLGHGFDRWVRLLEATSISDALIADGIGSWYVEELCENKSIELGQSNPLGMRFSPGYGDLDIRYNETVLKLTDGSKRAGVEVTNSKSLTPRKSITALQGLSDSEGITRTKGLIGCDQCKSKSCIYRAEGELCVSFRGN